MDTKRIIDFVLDFQENDPANRISEDLAKKTGYTGRKLYDGALCGVAAADDDIIASFQKNEKANLDMIQPEEWLPGAKSVISLFMPFARWITEENETGGWTSDGWLHGRIEGQAAIEKAAVSLAEMISGTGAEALVPARDPRYKVFAVFAGYHEQLFSSNWSERHVAYAAGLGTFGISRGLITELGISGRFISLITTLSIAPTPRKYTGLYEYCNSCGKCVQACPADAISLENLKDHNLCDARLNHVREKENPYYGCGKCQCGMPCSYGIPPAL